MKTGIFIAVATIAAITVSFIVPKPAESALAFGICDCSDKETVNFRLTMNPDATFSYFSNVDPKHVVDITGKWNMDGKTIRLSDYSAPVSIHDKWKLENDGGCITSRKGLEFSRLCKIKPCD